MGFKDKYDKMKQDLESAAQDSIDRQEDTMEYGTYFLIDQIPPGVNFWRPDYGAHLIDVVPFPLAGLWPNPKRKKGDWVHVIDLWVHTNVGAMFDQFVCQIRAHKEPDPICEFLRVNRLPTEEWKKHAPKRRCVYLIWSHDTPEEEAKGIQIWEVAYFNSGKHLDAISKNPKGGAPIPYSNTSTGKSIAFDITKSGTFTDSSGKERDSKDFSGFRFVDRDRPVPDEWGDIVFPLDRCINWRPSWEEQAKAFPFTIKPETQTSVATPDKQTDDTMTDDGEKELIPGLECEHCGTDVYKTKSGRVCAKGHGGIQGIVIQKKTEEQKSGDGECPAGGTLGVDIDKFDQCGSESCEVYDSCLSEANNITLAKTAKKTPPPAEEEQPKKTILRRRRSRS